MTPNVLKILALFLLVVQAAISSVPGRTLCIPVAACGAHHGAEEKSHHGDCDSHRAEHADHFHGSQCADAHAHDGCDCHVHLPLPDERTPPGARAERLTPPAILPRLIVACLTCNVVEPAGRPEIPEPPDPMRSAHAISLKATRLMI